MKAAELIEGLRRVVAPADGAQPASVVPSRGSLVAAAVLVPVTRSPEPALLLTRRTDHLHDHAGQVSFPGGRCEPTDPDPVATALRESAEEIGLAPAQVEVLGLLERYDTVTGFAITPVVGLVDPDFEPRPDPFEVAEVFTVPLTLALDAGRYRREHRRYGGRRRSYYVLPHPRHHIWGATAAILYRLARRVRGAVAESAGGV